MYIEWVDGRKDEWMSEWYVRKKRIKILGNLGFSFVSN